MVERRRIVETDFSYSIGTNTDPLNRLQGISYDTSTADATYTIDAHKSEGDPYEHECHIA